MKKFLAFCDRNKGLIFTIVVLALILVVSTDLFARVGGGGGKSGGGGGDGLGGLIIYIILMIPFPWNLIVLAVVIALFFIVKKKAAQRTILNQMPTGESHKTAKGYEDFKANNPAFDEAKFKEDVKETFIQIQTAWQDKDISKVRKYISDGMYQRLNTQFIMMDLLKQKNTIDNLLVKNIYIDKVDTDGLYDIVHVAIHASIVDKFVSEIYSKLNSGGKEEFVEYWSYIKKRGVEDKDLFHAVNCPSCGGELPKDAGEVCKCEFCGTMTNSPEYGWVLSEITQADDYITSNPMVAKTTNLHDKVKELIHDNEDFSVQLLEDKASNGYLQVETARVKNDPKIMRRFVTDEAFDKLKSTFGADQGFVYNRLFLNDVTLIGVGQKDNKNLLTIAIKVSYQRVVPDGKKVTILDQVVTSKTDILVLQRDADATAAKGNIYQHTCPSCAGSIDDTMDLKCPYCGNQINSTKIEWIVSDIMSLQEYYAYYSANSAYFFTPVKPEKLDALYKVRDYALNNVLIMIAADGVFDDEEMAFARKLAKKWGYSVDKIEPMFKMAESGKLVLRMPEDSKQRKKIYDLMLKAAQIDGNICENEQALLDEIKSRYLQ